MDKANGKKQTTPKRRRPMRTGVKRALVTLFTLFTLAAAGFLGYYLFQLTDIEIQGNESFSNEQILAYVDVEMGQYIFTIDLDAIRRELGTIPYIEVLEVKRVYPSKLLIRLRERTLKLAVKYGDTFVLTDEAGTAVEMAPSAQGLIELRGVTVEAAAIGSRIQGLDDYDVYLIDTILATFEESVIGEELSYIDISIPTMITMGVKNGLKIRIGDVDNMEQKLAWIDTLYPRLVEEGKRFGTLDASSKYGASYIPD